MVANGTDRAGAAASGITVLQRAQRTYLADVRGGVPSRHDALPEAFVVTGR